MQGRAFKHGFWGSAGCRHPEPGRLPGEGPLNSSKHPLKTQSTCSHGRLSRVARAVTLVYSYDCGSFARQLPAQDDTRGLHAPSFREVADNLIRLEW